MRFASTGHQDLFSGGDDVHWLSNFNHEITPTTGIILAVHIQKQWRQSEEEAVFVVAEEVEEVEVEEAPEDSLLQEPAMRWKMRA